MNIEKITNSKLAMNLAKRFPKTAIALAVYINSFNEPKPEKEVYTREIVSDDGKYQSVKEGFIPVSEALNKGLISKEAYSQIKQLR